MGLIIEELFSTPVISGGVMGDLPLEDRLKATTNASENCGTGAGGFQPGNTCAKSDGRSEIISADQVRPKPKAGKVSTGKASSKADSPSYSASDLVAELRAAGVNPHDRMGWQDGDPLGIGKIKVDAAKERAVGEAVLKAVQRQKADNPFQRLDVAKLHEEAGQGLTVRQFQAVLLRSPALRLGPFTQALAEHPDPRWLIPTRAGTLFYVEPRVTTNAGENCGTGAGGFQPGNTCAKGGEGGIETRTSVKDAKQWVRDRILTRKGDKVLEDILPDKVKQLLADSRSVLTEEAAKGGSGRAIGYSGRWEEGSTVNWGEGEIHTALHEIGHSVLHQGKVGESFLSSPLVDRWIPTAEKAIAEYKAVKQGNDTPPLFLDASSVGEMWADIFHCYVNPRTHVLLKYAMPETHKTLKELLGRVPYDVDVSPKTAAVIKDAVSLGHIRKRADLEKHGLTRDSYDQLRDLLMPPVQGWEKKYTKKEVADYGKRMQAAQDLLK